MKTESTAWPSGAGSWSWPGGCARSALIHRMRNLRGIEPADRARTGRSAPLGIVGGFKKYPAGHGVTDEQAHLLEAEQPRSPSDEHQRQSAPLLREHPLAKLVFLR